MNTSVYLAGPITGLTYQDARGWRKAAAQGLEAYNIATLDPLRDKDALADNDRVIERQPEYQQHHGIQFTPQFIVDRDLQDVRRCDGALINWRNPLPSVGTAMEIALLWDRHKPIVFWGDMPDHAMVNGVVRHHYHDLHDAIECLALILGRT